MFFFSFIILSFVSMIVARLYIAHEGFANTRDT